MRLASGLTAGRKRPVSTGEYSSISQGVVPTPLVYFATHNSDATSGVIVTGSHNPPDQNGFKIVLAGDALTPEEIRSL